MNLNHHNMPAKSGIRSCLLIVFLLITAGSYKILAQTFEEARHLAFSGQHDKARQVCKALLSKEYNTDVAILLARAYAWDAMTDSTRIILNEVLVHSPENSDALDAYADAEYWAKNYEKAIEYIERLIRLNPANAEALNKLQKFRLDVLKNTFRLTYTIDLFDKAFSRDPWQIAALSYGRKTKLGSVIARVNLADRYGSRGFQGEIDAYPKISENNYGYLNYGFSNGQVFPKNRMGAEWYHNFPKSFEGSLGMRILQFETSHVNIYTATLGKYVGNYWISLRSFVTPGTDGTSVSGFLMARRYFSDPENYLGLRLGYGVSPDDNRNLINSDQRLALKTQSVRVEFNHSINHVWIINAGAIWSNEERSTGNFSGYYTFDIGISRLF